MTGEVYVIIEVSNIRSAEGLQQYQAGARSQIGDRGGMVVARGGGTLAGEPSGALLIQKWPSESAFLEWQHSEDYRPLKEIRERCADFRIAIVPAI